eukprot:s172_g38.t2
MWASGVNEQAAEELRPVLIEHGVPKEMAQSRSQAAVKAIGGSQILGALASKILWKQLKTLGNQVKFQFLLPAELQDKIRTNAGQGAVGRPKGAKRGKKPPPQDRNVQIDPSKLCLPEGFFAAGGKSLAQIPLSAVGPLAEGIALVTHTEASPYLQQGQAVSNHPLALLIVQPELPLQTALAHAQVTVPCKCLANNEPVLLDGILCQIGKGYVEKGQSNSQIAVDVVKVGTIKFTVYRDEIDGSWEAFTEGPLRYIVAKVPLLRLCTQPQCQCAHWHNPDKLELKEVIVDVWRRQFLQSNFRPETAPQATLYSVCIRLPESLITSILALSGTAGIYSEPRTLDARSVHPEFAMVWMPKMSRSQLNHLKQTTPAAIGLGRVGERVGIRVLSIDAAAVHAALKPETVFLPSGPRHEFLTGPFPFGSDRNSLTRAFKALHWEARPVQPMSSVDAKGSMWLVQANQEPPDTILAMAHGDVVVTRYRPTKEPRDPKSRPIASAATLALCGGQSSDGKDPWINSDPWGGYQATTSRHPVVPEAADGLRQLETKLENKLKKAVLDSIPNPSNLMERDDVPDRVFQLESQMTQLLGRQQQLETQVTDTAQNQAAQIAGIQGQLQTQHQLLHGHIESSQQNIAAMFESQMAQIRFRYGEATHPGPTAKFCIGCFNPSGLTGKAQIINESLAFGDLWAISETHLSHRTLPMFRRSLGLTKSVFTSCVAGHPVPLRLQSQISGGWKGVAALSKHPTRAVPVDFSNEVRFSSRAVITATFLQDMWVTLGTVYGESAGQWHPQQLQHNEVLVREVATHVCFHSTGLRVVAGDFNNSEFDLLAFQILRDAGFKDLQTLAAERWGYDVQNTCKCATRVDFCFISPELQTLLGEVHVDQTVWPDHAVLSGTFFGGVRDVPRFVWKLPQPLQWPSFHVDQVEDIEGGHATAAYAKMWQEAESAAVQASPVPIRKACLGRAATLAPRRVFGQAHAPLKPAREGDILPQFFGTSVQHAHWYRQVRRLQAYCRFAKSPKPAKDGTHGAQVWGSIVRGKGFAPNFPAWWAHLQHRVPEAPAVFPMAPPNCCVALAIYDSCVIALRQLEKTLRANSRAYAVARRQADPRLIFQDIRQISPDSVEMLVKPSSSKVVDVDHDTGCIHLQHPVQWDVSQPVYTKGHQLSVVHVEDTWMWVEDTALVDIGATVSQTQLTGDLEELFRLFQADWSQRSKSAKRPVVAETLTLLGVPPETMTAWHGAVNAMNRHFQIRGSFSSATPSCTGYAEGDGMSILAMLAINTLFHTWFEASQVPIQPLSFVDDWQLLLQHHSHAQSALAQLQRFCDLVDLTLDHRKTFAWSMDAEGRKHLRSSGIRVVTHCRALGAHMQLSRQHTNRTLQQRVQGLHDLWDRLRLSPSPYKAKAMCLTTAAWPWGLHGIAATCLGAQVIGRLRSGAMRGLGADSSGANPWIHLGLVESPDHDPGFWSIIQTLRCARECGDADWVMPVLADLAKSASWSDPHSFSCTLITRCHSLGWSFTSEGRLLDSFGTFCLFGSSMPELLYRAEIAWLSVVWQAVSHRPGLATLTQVDARSTRKFVASLGPEEAGMMRTILNGTHFTGEAKQYWMDDEQGLCPFCHCSDSRYHRFWQCEAFDAERGNLTEEQWAALPSLPEALTCYGWVLRAPSWTDWTSCMAASFDTPALSHPFHVEDPWLDVFTDGSCLWPQKQYRLASWAVVQASPANTTLCAASSKVLVAGHVPGLLQSAYRAELLAVCMALRIARQSAKPMRIWCDCQGVVDGVSKLLRRSRRVRVNGRHSDLWREVEDLLNEIGRDSVQITKVAAHQDTSSTVSGFEAWCYLYNGLADQAAQLANMTRPDSFWTLHKQYIAETEAAQSLAIALQRVMISISRKILFHQVEARQEPHEAQPLPAVVVSPACPHPWQGLPKVPSVTSSTLRRFGTRVVHLLVSWLYHALAGAPTPEDRWISFYQLYIDYMLATGEGGPLHLTVWEDPRDRPHADLLSIAFKKRCSWFTHVLKTVMADMDIQFLTRYTRTESHMLLVSTSCLWCPWPPNRLEVVEEWLVRHLQYPATRNGTSLNRLPTAQRSSLFSTVPQCTVQTR